MFLSICCCCCGLCRGYSKFCTGFSCSALFFWLRLEPPCACTIKWIQKLSRRCNVKHKNTQILMKNGVSIILGLWHSVSEFMFLNLCSYVVIFIFILSILSVYICFWYACMYFLESWVLSSSLFCFLSSSVSSLILSSFMCFPLLASCLILGVICL